MRVSQSFCASGRSAPASPARPGRRHQRAAQEHVAGEQHDHQRARDHDAGEKVADRDLDHRGVDDDDARRRDDGAERAAGADRAGDQVFGVAVAQHCRRRHHADDGFDRADDAGRRGEHRAHQQRRDGEAAGQPPDPQLRHGEEALGDARAFAHRAHEDEERHCREGMVDQDVVRAPGELHADAGAEEVEPEDEGERDQRERDRKAGEDEQKQRREHPKRRGPTATPWLSRRPRTPARGGESRGDGAGPRRRSRTRARSARAR